MELLLLKTVVLSTVLFGFHYLFLQKEKTFGFNRFYLLGALIFSYTVPLLTIADPFRTERKPRLIVGELIEHFQVGSSTTSAAFDWTQVLIALYGLITIFFLTRFIYSIVKIKRLKGERICYKNQKVVVLNCDQAPFSFINTIYINRKYVIDGEIDERILLHEHCHVTEKHTMDIFLVELLRIFFWFNPTLYFYKKAMITNHEFLADDHVLRRSYDRSAYQSLILNEVLRSQNLNLTQSFNFNNTKKRFIMMTTKKSRFSWLKKLSLLPLVAVLFLLFAKKMTAQTETSSATATKVTKSPTRLPVIADAPDVAKIERSSSDTFNDAVIAEQIKTDTIRKKPEEKISAPTSPPPPPPPHEFKGILPQFPNGINAYRTLLASSFDTSVLKGTTGTIRTTIYFNINEDGKISDIRAEGNNEAFNREAERAVASTQDRVWTPAMENGKAAIYRFMMPLTMTFE